MSESSNSFKDEMPAILPNTNNANLQGGGDVNPQDIQINLPSLSEITHQNNNANNPNNNPNSNGYTSSNNIYGDSSGTKNTSTNINNNNNGNPNNIELGYNSMGGGIYNTNNNNQLQPPNFTKPEINQKYSLNNNVNINGENSASSNEKIMGNLGITGNSSNQQPPVQQVIIVEVPAEGQKVNSANDNYQINDRNNDECCDDCCYCSAPKNQPFSCCEITGRFCCFIVFLQYILCIFSYVVFGIYTFSRFCCGFCG